MIASEETRVWVFDLAAWWLESFGGFETFATRTTMVLPTEDDFPVDLSLEGEELAQDYLAFVLEHAGLSEWPIVVSLEEAPDVASVLQGVPHALAGAVEAHEPSLIGEEDPLLIPCAPTLLDDPMALIAHLARGAAHYHLYDARTPLPCDEDEREYVVDLATCLLGFGCFAANTAFRFEQHTSGMMIGWGFRRGGALSELDVSYVVALVAELLETPAKELEPHLRPNPREYVRDARRELRGRRAELARLREIPPGGVGPYR